MKTWRQMKRWDWLNEIQKTTVQYVMNDFKSC